MYSILRMIVDTVASILGGILLLRFWMQAVRVRPPSSIAHFLFQLTDWLVRPLRKILPGLGGYDWATLIGAFLVSMLAVAAGYWMMPFFSIRFVLLPDYLDRVERDIIVRALEKTRYNRTKAAQLLGISFRQLRYQMQKLAICEPE